MAAQFTQVSLEDIVVFLKRAFHALEPQRQINVRGETAIELPLSDKVAILVFTTVGYGGASAAGVGADAIRVGLYRNGRPLQSGKLPIVKRTQGWKDNLRERVEDALERYDDRADEIERGDFIRW
jgi:hypothetical protein